MGIETKEKAITLISLVITIIILLILAGVSIALLMGESGILKNATEATDETRKAEALESLQLKVLASFDETGKLNLENLKNELDVDETIVLPYNLTSEGYNFRIEEDGKVILLGENSGDENQVVIPDEPIYEELNGTGKEPPTYMDFNGTSYIEVYSSSFNQSDLTNGFTIATKINVDRTQNTKAHMGIYGSHTGGTGIAMQFTSTSQELWGMDYTPYNDKWIDLVFVYDDTAQKYIVYIDGEEKIVLENRTFSPYTIAFMLGNSYRGEDRYLDGKMSAMKVWDVELTQEEVKEINLYNPEVIVRPDDIYANFQLGSEEQIAEFGVIKGAEYEINGYPEFQLQQATVNEKEVVQILDIDESIYGLEWDILYKLKSDQEWENLNTETFEINPGEIYEVKLVNAKEETEVKEIVGQKQQPKNYMELNGSTYISIDTDKFKQSDIITTGFTIATKINIDRSSNNKSYMGIWGNHSGSTGIALQFTGTTNELWGVDYTQYNNKWIDLVVTYNYITKEYILYIDGEQQALLTNINPVPYSQPMIIGSSLSQYNRYLVGKISSFKVWDIALTVEEIKQLDLLNEEINVSNEKIYANFQLESLEKVQEFGTIVGNGYKFIQE